MAKAPQSKLHVTGSPRSRIDLWDLIPFAVILLHLVGSPFTKVEESFTIQAARDYLKLFNDPEFSLEKFDHHQFPGAVPRSFVGPLVLSLCAQVYSKVLLFVGLRLDHGLQLQALVRALLGLVNAFAIVYFRSAVAQLSGKLAGIFYILLQSSQFHYMYYASRTLPNFLATPFALFAFSFWVKYHGRTRYQLSLCCLGIAAIIFRAELGLLASLIALAGIWTKEITMSEIFQATYTAGLLSIGTTVLLDSKMWGFPVWAEGYAFYYNAIQGKSSDWGTSPTYFYFLNSLPRLLLNPVTFLGFPLSGLGLRSIFGRDRVRTLSAIGLIYIAIYSLQPHKEWRFIIYVIPIFTAVSAQGAAFVFTRRRKSFLYASLSIVIVLSIAASSALAAVMHHVSSLNYPGGQAIETLPKLDDRTNLNVYADVYSCMTGITLFTTDDLPPSWVFNKTEDAETLSSQSFWNQLDWSLSSSPQNLDSETWQTIYTVFEFNGFRRQAINLPALRGIAIPIVAPVYKAKLRLYVNNNRYGSPDQRDHLQANGWIMQIRDAGATKSEKRIRAFFDEYFPSAQYRIVYPGMKLKKDHVEDRINIHLDTRENLMHVSMG